MAASGIRKTAMDEGDPQDDIVTMPTPTPTPTPTPLNYSYFPPLTLPPTDEKNPTTASYIISTIERYKSGQRVSTGPLLRFHIDELQYQELERELSEDEFWRNKLRRHYFPSQRLFILRMPSRIHELFLVKVHDEIRRQLRNLKGASSKFAQDIIFEASTTFTPSDPKCGPHDPDGSFRHTKQAFPGLITEVAYSKDSKVFKRLADQYILGSHLRVRALVAFDVPYKAKKKKATVSVWRARPLQEDEEKVWSTTSEVQVFRDDSGEPNLDPNSGLRVHLLDFASAEFCETFDNLDGTIFISCATLCTFLNEVEALTHCQPLITAQPGLRMRYGSETSEEELNTDDERDVARAEERAAERAQRNDSSYENDSSMTSGGG